MMKPIDRIIITCWQGDLWLTRICVASIRYWYPDIPIGLLKDTSQGDFSTDELETYWNISVVATPNPPRGMFTKMEAFHLPGRQRILLLDSDIIFLGRVLEVIGKYHGDFIVNWNGNQPLTREEKIRYSRDGYYHLEKLEQLLPDFEAPDYFFNAGQMLITSSILPRERFETYLCGQPPLEKVKDSDVIFKHEQGILNVLLPIMQREGKCCLHICDFVRWSIHKEMVWDFEVEQLKNRTGYPYLIHWAEHKPFHKTGFIRGDLMGFYEDFYYNRIPRGEWKRNYRLARRARKKITSKNLRLIALARKTVDLEQLIHNERSPGKEANPAAYIR